MRWMKIKLIVTIIVLILWSSINLYAAVVDETTQVIARYYAKKLLQTDLVEYKYHATYYNLDERPYAHVFFCRTPDGTGDEKVLTLAIAPDRNQFPLLFYYFGVPLDKIWQIRLDISDSSRVIVSGMGFYFETRNGIVDPYLLSTQNNPSPVQNELTDPPGTQSSQRAFQINKNVHLKRCAAWNVLDRALAEDETPMEAYEFIVPGCPNYLWYLNCGVISDVMILGFWDDHGYDRFIPGGTSQDGYYWAVAEELCLTGPYTRQNSGLESTIVYYTQASEYGNDAAFVRLDEFRIWEDYRSFFDTYNAPLGIYWEGPPYTSEPFHGHALVGIGYKIDGEQRFMIYYDTFNVTMVYRNFDEFLANENSRFWPTVPKSMVPESYQLMKPLSVNTSIEDTISLHPISLLFSPDLIPMYKSYHCMTSTDINLDGMNDLIVGNFCNVFKPIQPLELYIQNEGGFIKNDPWVPQFGKFETVHVIRAQDFDNDGDTDIASAGIWSKVRLFINQNGILGNTPVLIDTGTIGTERIMDLAWCDYDLDGDFDLISSTQNDIRIYPNQNNLFTEIFHIDSETEYDQVKTADIDADDYPDLIACTRTGSVVIFKNESGQFAETPFFHPATGHGAMAFDVADVDQDGFLEIVTVDDGQLVLFDNQEGTLSETAQYLGNTIDCYAKDVVLNDLDEDGFPELIVANYNTHNCIFKNINGTLQSTPCWTSDEVIPTPRVQVHDLWGDGKKQIFFLKPRGAMPEFFEIESLKPQSPSNLQAHLLVDQIHVTWQDNSDDEEGFVLEKKVMPGVFPIVWEVADTLMENRTSCQIDNPGGDLTYYFRVYAFNEYGNSNCSEETSISTGLQLIYLDIISPNGGEIWGVGTSHEITWTSSTTLPPAHVNILLSTDEGSNWHDPPVASNIANTGSYIWNVPNTPSTECLIKIEDASGGSPYDLSNQPFTITDSTIPQTPYLGSAFQLPCQIELEDYDLGGMDVAYWDADSGNNGGQYRNDNVDIEITNDTGGGYNIGWTQDKEWLEYTINSAGEVMDIEIRVATVNSDRQCRLLLEGDTLCTVDLPNTGGWQNWETVTAENIMIPKGTNQVLRFEVIESWVNFNWIKFTPNNSVQEDSLHFQFTSNTGQNCTVVVPSSIEPQYGDGTLLGSGDEIGVFNSAGLCCGAVVWNGENVAITVWGDNIQTADTIDGFLENDTLRFRIWNSKKDKEYKASACFEDESDCVYHTDGYGVLAKLIAQISTGIDNTEISVFPDKFLLRQNRPNPFNPETTIEFHLPEQAEVQLTVYDMNGREVSCLVQETLSTGIHTVKWKGTDENGLPMASGIYFYQMVANPASGSRKSMVQVKKMIFMK